MSGFRSSKDFVFSRFGTTVMNVVVHRVVEQHGVLRHDPDRRPQARLSDIPYVHAVYAYRARLHVIKPVQEPGKCRFAGDARADHRDLPAPRHVERNVVQDLAIVLVSEIDVIETHGQRTHRQVDGAGPIFDFAMFLEQSEHPAHVRQRLLDLAVHHAEEIQRDVELDQQPVDEYEVAERERTSDHALRSKNHEQRHRDRDDETLTDIEQPQRGLGRNRGTLVLPQVLIVAPGLVLLVIEVLDGLVVEKAVDGTGVGARIELVSATAYVGAPLGDPDREAD